MGENMQCLTHCAGTQRSQCPDIARLLAAGAFEPPHSFLARCWPIVLLLHSWLRFDTWPGLPRGDGFFFDPDVLQEGPGIVTVLFCVLSMMSFCVSRAFLCVCFFVPCNFYVFLRVSFSTVSVFGCKLFSL